MYSIALNSNNHTFQLNHVSSALKLTHERNVILLQQVGRRGLPGEGDKNFTQAFTNSSTVSLTHSLNKYPSVTVIDSAGDEVVGDVSYDDLNNVTLSFQGSFSGTATLN